LGLLVSGCSAPLTVAPTPSGVMDDPAQARPLGAPAEKPIQSDPRALASLRFTAQAQRHLEAKRPDPAIRTLERAITLDPANGRNYYFLAEAYILKGIFGQAREFNHLAGIHLTDDPSWIKRVRQQRDRIAEKE
jgi:tetratricopeptide (TPR) repeat protein